MLECDDEGRWLPVRLGPTIKRGGERSVYLHPTRPDCVVKVATRPAGVVRNELEMAFFLAAPPAVSEHIACIHGAVDTNVGPGIVCEFICDGDGEQSPSLKQAVQKQNLPLDRALAMIGTVFDWAATNRVPLSDSNPHNFLYQSRPNGSRLVLIDGFGPGNRGLKWRLRMAWPRLLLAKNTKARRKIEASLRRA